MSENKLGDSLSPLIIDIGSRNVKYSQPLTNASQIMQQIYIAKQELKEKRENYALSSSQMLQLEEEEINALDEEEINANTIFDYKGSIRSIPTVNCIYDLEISENNASEYIIELMHALKDFDKEPKYSFEFSGAKETIQCLRFENEPIYQGKINSNLEESYYKIIQSIGQRQFDKNYFNEERFAETPLIITQDALTLSELEEQNQKIYEMCFEDFNAQYVLICSQAMINLMSYNLTNGLVVDIGESKTSITPIKNGFACYDKAMHSKFLCGRTISILLAQIKNYNTSSSEAISLENFYNASVAKHQAFDKTMDDNSSYSYLKYLFSYPELFRSLHRDENKTCHEGIRDFITNQNNKDYNKITSILSKVKNANGIHSQSQSNRNGFNDVTSFDWELGLNKFYSVHSDPYSIEKNIFQSESNYLNKNELNIYRQNSLVHFISYQLEKCVSEDIENANNYSNIVFCGGVLNTPGLKSIIQSDFKNMMYSNFDKNVSLYFPNDEDDASVSFYKGANYIAKMNGLQNLMVSRQDYYELGMQGLGYNYI